ncbi:MAG TPA: hypothetical protein PLP11_09070 [Bacteroidales bacterium]|nr:hypothetical protein [Bacteroidales bacterium]
MRKIASILLIAAAAVFVFNSCQPYEEGPSISLLSKTTRLVGDWTIDTWLANDTEQDISSTQPRMSFVKDGSGSMTINVFNFAVTVDLEWEFVGDDGIRYRVKKHAWEDWTEYTILRLSNDELFIERTYLPEGSEANVTERIELSKN